MAVCDVCGASDGLTVIDMGPRLGLRFVVTKRGGLCCIGPDDPWLPALRRRIPGTKRLKPLEEVDDGE